MRLMIVLALACGHRDMPRKSVRSVPATDAAIDAPVDAPVVVDTPIDAPVDVPIAHDQPSPPVYVGRIIGVNADTKTLGSILIVDFGKKRGLDKNWKAVLLDDDNKRGEKVEVVNVDETRCLVRSKLPTDVARKYHRVVFEP